MLLIYPPGARSTEPPLGIARLAGFLEKKGVEVRCLDFCQEGLEYLLHLEIEADDPWTRGALKRRERSLAQIRTMATYGNRDRYRRAVLDLNRAIKAASRASGTEAGLADYRDPRLSPQKRSDLLFAAEHFEENVFFPLYRKRIEEMLPVRSREPVGISLTFLSQALPTFSLIGYLRNAHPENPILLGGGLINSWIGQGGLSAKENFGGLVEALFPGRGEESLGPYLGFVSGPDRGGETSAIPEFGQFDSQGYMAPVRIIPYNFSHGCPWGRCSFCLENSGGGGYSGLRAESARDEIGALAKRHEPGLLHFTDNEISPLYLRMLADSRLGIPWYGFARFSPLLADPAFCKRLAASGCVMLQLGLESGDQGVLDALDKGTRLEEIDRAMKCLKEAGIGLFIYLLFGTPAEDLDSARRTRDFVVARAECIDFLNIAIFNMPVASEEAGRLSTRKFYEGEFSLYCEFEHPKGWNRDMVRYFLSSEFESEPKVRGILKRNPPVFTSNHAPFFLHPTPEKSEVP